MLCKCIHCLVSFFVLFSGTYFIKTDFFHFFRLATGVYNLRRRYKQGLSYPSWVGNAGGDKVTPTIENTIHGAPATLLFRAVEAMINYEFHPLKTILKAVQDNALEFPATHGNTALARAAGGRAYWLIGASRLNERFAARDAILDQIRVMNQPFWDSIQPDDNNGKELRCGLTFITEYFQGTLRKCKLVMAQSKVCGSGTDANIAKFNKNKYEVELYTVGGGFHAEFASLESTTLRFLDAAHIVSGPAANRKYTIQVKNLNGMWMDMTATHVPTPANNANQKYFAQLPQEKGNRRPFNELFEKFHNDYLAIRNANAKEGKERKKFSANEISKEHKNAIRELGIKMCYMPPKQTTYDHTLSTPYATNSNVRIREIFVDMTRNMVRNQPIEMGNAKTGKWNLQSILPPEPGTGFVSGAVNKQSTYTFKADNVLSRLTQSGFTPAEIVAVREVCRAVSCGDLIVHPKWYGRQTQLSKLIGLLYCARNIPGWGNFPSTEDIMTVAINRQAQIEGHAGAGDAENKNKIPVQYYCKIFETELGNPAKHFNLFDTRIRAHPTPVKFSLAGIESFPSTLIPCISHNAAETSLQRALQDVALLTTREQNQNLATLSVYKLLLQWVIDHQNEIPKHQQCVLDWFNQRASYSPEDLEPTIRASPRKRRKTNKDIQEN